ncbi:hypothetical protein B0O80DRAFT_12755 [Mortierella sp. GBAus27b]|nr:hypothetical protein B0O80DRAFT_12755 [Mortierella sp. GBAus27b]
MPHYAPPTCAKRGPEGHREAGVPNMSHLTHLDYNYKPLPAPTAPHHVIIMHLHGRSMLIHSRPENTPLHAFSLFFIYKHHPISVAIDPINHALYTQNNTLNKRERER